MTPKTMGCALLLMFAAVAASAQTASYTYNWNGTTAGGPTFTRPMEDLNELSVSGLAAKYRAFTFHVTLGGPYDFFSDAENHWDNFLILYGNSFNAGTPLANALIANDDHPDDGVGHAGFTFTLASNRTYVLVTTGFDVATSDYGRYFNSITGPGVVTAGVAAVPELRTYALFVAGLAAVGAIVRRRRMPAVA